MHSQYKDQVFRKAGISYLVLDPCPEAPDFLLVRSIDPARRIVRMHRDEVSERVTVPQPLAGLQH